MRPFTIHWGGAVWTLIPSPNTGPEADNIKVRPLAHLGKAGALQSNVPELQLAGPGVDASSMPHLSSPMKR